MAESASFVEIPLYGGRGKGKQIGVAKVSPEDARLVLEYRWGVNGCGYASIYRNHNAILMHRLILEAPKEFVVDHVNHDTLDNRRENIRLCTEAENMRNKVMQSNNKTGAIGVYWHKGKKRWAAQIRICRRIKHLGRFRNIEDAIVARKEAEKTYFGEFAYKA
jgi:hypothetical protein